MSFTTKKHLGMYGIAAIMVAVVYTFAIVPETNTVVFDDISTPVFNAQTKTSVADTMSVLTIPISLPTSLPNGVTFEKSLVASDGKSAHIIFSKSDLVIKYLVQETDFDPIKSISVPVKPITVTTSVNGTVVGTETFSQTGGNYSMSRIHSVDAVLVTGDTDKPNKLAWYKDGIFHQIHADLPHNELISIGSSIPAATQ